MNVFKVRKFPAIDAGTTGIKNCLHIPGSVSSSGIGHEMSLSCASYQTSTTVLRELLVLVATLVLLQS